MSDGGELLRGVLDKNCRMSRLRGYTIECGALQAGITATYSGTYKVDPDAHFLIYSVCAYRTDSANGALVDATFVGDVGSDGATMQLTKISDAKPMAWPDNFMTFGQWGAPFTRQHVLPEYIYLAPNDLVRAEFQLLNNAAGAAGTVGVTLFGMEYRK